MLSPQYRAIALAVLAITCWGTGTAVALALKPIHPLIIFMGIYGVFAFLQFIFIEKKSLFTDIDQKIMWIIVLCSVVGNLAFFAAVKMIPPENFSLICETWPLLVYIYWSIANRRISPVSTLISILGIYLIMH